MNIKVNKIILFIGITCLFLLPLKALAKNNLSRIYIFGAAVNYADSTAYFTEIQQLDGALVSNKTGFLYQRERYSEQLKSYLYQKGISNVVCVTIFNGDRKRVENKYLKYRKSYTDKFEYKLVMIPLSDFKYQVQKD